MRSGALGRREFLHGVDERRHSTRTENEGAAQCFQPAIDRGLGVVSILLLFDESVDERPRSESTRSIWSEGSSRNRSRTSSAAMPGCSAT
jgi:hypothetical protein